MFERLPGPDDPRIADYRDVPDAALLRSRGVFVAEGGLVVQRLIEDGRYTLRSVLVSETARRRLESSLGAVAERLPIYVCAAGDFLGITGHDLHRGCLAIVERPDPLRAADLARAARTLVVMEGVSNADNVGGVFRNAAAFGADGVLLSPTCCDPLYRKAIRTSMAATLRVPFARLDDWPADLWRLRASGFAIVALTPREPAVDVSAFAAGPRPERIALVVGTEGGGLSAGVEAGADYRIRIAMQPGVDSLNLAVAAGIALHALRL